MEEDLDKEERSIFEDILEETVFRRSLLPWWFKIFIFIFMITGVLIPLGFITKILGYYFHFSLYGLNSVETFVPMGVVISVLFFLKAVVSFGLWFEKDWAIKLGYIDGGVGILICLYSMFLIPFIDSNPNYSLNIRFELALLIPYLYKLKNIENDWISGEKSV